MSIFGWTSVVGTCSIQGNLVLMSQIALPNPTMICADYTWVLGIALGPFIGGAIQRNLNWRWIYYIQIIFNVRENNAYL